MLSNKKRATTPEASEAMSKAAKVRHAKARAAKKVGLVVVPQTHEARFQALLDKTHLKMTPAELRDMATLFVGELSPSTAYAIYALELAGVREDLKEFLDHQSISDGAKIKALALRADLAKGQLDAAKDLGLLDQNHPERRVQQLIQIVMANTPVETQQVILDQIRTQMLLIGPA